MDGKIKNNLNHCTPYQLITFKWSYQTGLECGGRFGKIGVSGGTKGKLRDGDVNVISRLAYVWNPLLALWTFYFLEVVLWLWCRMIREALGVSSCLYHVKFVTPVFGKEENWEDGKC